MDPDSILNLNDIKKRKLASKEKPKMFLICWSASQPCSHRATQLQWKHNRYVLKPAERFEGNTTGINLHALAELSVCAGFVLVPAVPEPTLDLSRLPVQLLWQAI